MSRVYCQITGSALETNAAGHCPDCREFTDPVAHRLLDGPACQAFVPCRKSPYASEHGHPCELPAGHDGGRAACQAPAAVAACRALEPLATTMAATRSTRPAPL